LNTDLYGRIAAPDHHYTLTAKWLRISVFGGMKRAALKRLLPRQNWRIGIVKGAGRINDGARPKRIPCRRTDRKPFSIPFDRCNALIASDRQLKICPVIL